MGYYTEFTLRVRSDDPPAQEVLKAVTNGDYDIPLNSNGHCYDSLKWYEHEEDMRAASRHYPDAVFALRGHGENIGDNWIKYFKNGKFYKHEIQEELFEFYDERKLK